MLLRYLIPLSLIFSFFLNAQNSDQVNHIQVAPVVYKGDTLFFLSQGVNEYPVAFRAKQVSARYSEITDAFDSDSDSLYLKNEGATTRIFYNKELALLLTDRDAEANYTTRKELANKQIDFLYEIIEGNKVLELTTKQWLIRIGYFTLALAALVLALKLIGWLFKKLNAYLSKFDRTFLKRRKNLLKYFIPKNTANIFVFISNLFKYIIIFLLLVTYLPFVFSFFPQTEGLVATFYGYIETPVKFVFHGVVNFLPSLVFILVILIFTRYIIRVMKDIVDDIEDEKLVIQGFPKDWAGMTQKIFSLAIYALALVMIYPHLPGSASPAFKGVSIFIGALLSFGSTSAVSNIVAGVVITYMRAFQIGDRIKIQNTVGDVIEKTLLVTRIRTPKNEDVTIPNANIINNHMINYTANTRKNGLVLNTTVTIGYDVPWRIVEGLLIQAAEKSLNVEKEPKPFVLKTSLDDNYVSYQLNAYTKDAQRIPRSYSSIHENILEEFNKAGIEILSPSYVAARDGNLSTIPDELSSESRSPIERIVDHLTGRNQKVTISKPEKDSDTEA